MGNFSRNSAKVRMDIFKPSGKWYDFFEVDMGDFYHEDLINKAVKNAFKDKIKTDFKNAQDYFDKHKDWYLVCLEPYYENNYPIMIQL